MNHKTLPLTGIRVVDMTRVMSGPLCTVMLADLGAEVIKVESGGGDITRQVGGHMRNGVTAMFIALNRGKKSFLVDLRAPEGLSALVSLVTTADVFVENFRPGVAETMGLGEAQLRNENPGLIYLSINGYGREGAMANDPTYDTVVQGQTGMIARQMSPDGRVDKVRSFPVDKLSGMFGAQAVLAALFERERTGIGQAIDVPMFDATMYYLWSDVLGEFTFAEGDYTRVGDTWRGAGATETADGRIVLLVVALKEIHGALRAGGLGELVTDERFATLSAFMSNQHDYHSLLRDAYGRFATADLLERLRAEGVAASAVMQPEDVINDVRLTGGDFFAHWQHPQAGRIRQPRSPIRFRRQRHEPHPSAPTLGEHTEALLAELGYSQASIADWILGGARR